jgi:hypothetical protein
VTNRLPAHTKCGSYDDLRILEEFYPLGLIVSLAVEQALCGREETLVGIIRSPS